LTTVVVDKETLPILLSVANGTAVKYVIINGKPKDTELKLAKEKGFKLEEFVNIEHLGSSKPVEKIVPGKPGIIMVQPTHFQLNQLCLQDRTISVAYTSQRLNLAR
jgi:hypothetical protein